MTLDTKVYVHDAVSLGDLFAKCNALLGAGEGVRSEDSEGYAKDGSRILQNKPGQGLPAWLMIYYRPGAPLRADADACDDNCWISEDPEGEDEHYHKPAHYLRVSFDTAYGYSDELGRGCGDLHACYVAELGRWLDERGVGWSWENGYDGAIYGGEDRYTRLTTLMQSGHRATRWFESWVLPAVRAAATES